MDSLTLPIVSDGSEFGQRRAKKILGGKIGKELLLEEQ
jgi:hypothetical protein